MNRVIRTERGWAGHFICAERCRFRRNTLLELGDVRIVVSTVGAMWSRDGVMPETIGHERYYETMAFHAESVSVAGYAYTEANVSREVGFESPWSIDSWNTPGVDVQADSMHEAVVAELSERMISGKQGAS